MGDLKSLTPKAFLAYYEAIDEFGKNNGYSLTVAENLDIKYEMTIEKIHLSSPSAAHGGAIAGFMDAVLGTTALVGAFQEQKICSTIEFKMNFFSPVKLGDNLVGTGSIEHRGKSFISTSGSIHHKDSQEIVAKGLGTFNLYPITKRFNEVDLEEILKLST